VASAIDLLTYFKELTEKPPRTLVAGVFEKTGVKPALLETHTNPGLADETPKNGGTED
jgi:hypothetical protein